jgi:hypothetical protein
MALEAYSDSDWAQCIDTRCSTTEVIFLVNGSPVHYISSKQPTIAHSSTEAELVAANVAARDLTWFQKPSCAWKVPFSTAALRIDDKPQREIIDGKQVGRIGTIALGIDNKGCVDIAHANGVTKLSKSISTSSTNIFSNRSRQNMSDSPKTALQTKKADFLTKPPKHTLFTRACAALHLT